jgi:hypothetical protein
VFLSTPCRPPAAAAACAPVCREERYNEIRDEMRHMLARVGWKPDFIEKSVPILPISGWMGDNLITKSEKMGWWKGMTVKTVDGRDVSVNCLLDVSHSAGAMRGGLSRGSCIG